MSKRVKDHTFKTPNSVSVKVQGNQQLSTTNQNDSANSNDLSFIIEDILGKRIGNDSINFDEEKRHKVLNRLVYNFYCRIYPIPPHFITIV